MRNPFSRKDSADDARGLVTSGQEHAASRNYMAALENLLKAEKSILRLPEGRWSPETRTLLAECLSYQCSALTQLGLVDQAVIAGKRAVEMFGGLMQENIDVRASMAEATSHHGAAYRAQGHPEASVAAFYFGVSLAERLVAESVGNPSEHRRHKVLLQGLLIGYGNALSALQQFKEADSIFDRAIEILTPLVSGAAMPESENVLAILLMNKAICNRSMGRYEEALGLHDQALEIRTRLVTTSTVADFRRDLALSHQNRGYLLFEMNRLEEALRSYQEAERILAELVINEGKNEHGSALMRVAQARIFTEAALRNGGNLP